MWPFRPKNPFVPRNAIKELIWKSKWEKNVCQALGIVPRYDNVNGIKYLAVEDLAEILDALITRQTHLDEAFDRHLDRMEKRLKKLEDAYKKPDA